ncbi:MAG: hypothetical protein GTO18_20880 [Anaerolineales bacterium]|nr:hypothetical protein [Anaerolineales bacterium]
MVSTMGILVVLLFIGLMIGFFFVEKRWPSTFRHLHAYERLDDALEKAVEAGERVHLSLGTGSIIGTESAPALVGLAILSRIAASTAVSDKPVVVSSGDGAMTALAQDSLYSSYKKLGVTSRFDPSSSRMLGPTRYSYTAGVPTLLIDEEVSVHIMHGSYGSEGALVASFGERSESFVIAGTDHVQSQALLYAIAEEPLVGEEVFAGGAYLNVGDFHKASLRTQDIVRVIIIAVIVIGVILRTLQVID